MNADKIIQQAESWLGRNEADGSHKEIIDIYNRIRPLPRGYKVKYTGDAWCAVFISSVAIKCDAVYIIPLECSCQRMIDKAVEMGIWREDDTYVPAVADIIMYNYDEKKQSADNTGWADHVGYVVSVKDGVIKVIEGNYNNKVGYRNINVGDTIIRGYICPHYKQTKNESEEKKMRYFKLNEEMNIRKTPNGTKVGVAPVGAVISGTEFGTSNGIQWLKTSYNGVEGYIAVLPTSKGYAVEIEAPSGENELKRLKTAIAEAVKILNEVI